MQPLSNHNKIPFSSDHSRWRVVTFLLALLGFWLWLTLPSAAQDLDSMPWRDHESSELVPVNVQERGAAVTSNRNLIPEKVVAKRPPTATNWNWNWNWGSGNSGAWAGFGPFLVCGMSIIGAVLLIGLIVWGFMNSRIEIGSDTDSSRPDRTIAESIRQLPFEMDATLGDFRQQAQSAYTAGDFRKALIFLFSHVLVTLDQQKLVRLKKGKTNRQYLRELSPNPPLTGYYGDVMVPFEQTFFGDYPITKDIFEGCWQGLDEFQRSVTAAHSNTVEMAGTDV